MFLRYIYSDGNIIKDKVVPEDFVYISKGYMAQCAGITPPKGIYSHISGIDLVQAKNMYSIGPILTSLFPILRGLWEMG